MKISAALGAGAFVLLETCCLILVPTKTVWSKFDQCSRPGTAARCRGRGGAGEQEGRARPRPHQQRSSSGRLLVGGQQESRPHTRQPRLVQGVQHGKTAGRSEYYRAGRQADQPGVSALITAGQAAAAEVETETESQQQLGWQVGPQLLLRGGGAVGGGHRGQPLAGQPGLGRGHGTPHSNANSVGWLCDWLRWLVAAVSLL